MAWCQRGEIRRKEMSIKRRICNVCGKDFVHDARESHNTVKTTVQVNTPLLGRKKNPINELCWFVRTQITTNCSTQDICDDCAVKQIKKAATKLHKRDVETN